MIAELREQLAAAVQERDGWHCDASSHLAELCDKQAEVNALEARVQVMENASEWLWICLANVSSGNWELQPLTWQEAVKKARDAYFATISPPPEVQP